MPARPLAPLFAALLASLTDPGCNFGDYEPCNGIYSERVMQVPIEMLESYLSDDGQTLTSCHRLCNGLPVDASTGGEPTGGSTGSAATSEADTGTTTTSAADTDSAGTTSSASTSEGTGGTETTGDATTSAATDSTGTPDGTMDTTVSGEEDDDEYYDPYLTCWRGQTIDGVVEVNCRTLVGSCGRRPEGTVDVRTPTAADPELAWLLAAAALESISIPAFTELSAALARHDAPDDLCAAALRAADDERRHASIMIDLVRRCGGDPVSPLVEPSPVSDLEALARHNAIEGCVRETWGALLAAFQARNATAPDVRAALAGIADDERAHAELAWQIDAWALTRLSPAARARIDAARNAAVQALLAEADDFGVGLYQVGLPNASQARALLRGLDVALWAARVAA